MSSGISPWATGDTLPNWTVNLASGVDGAWDLTGANASQLQLIIYSVTTVGGSAPTYTQIGTGAGIFTILQVSPAIIQYALAAADIPASAGTYAVRFRYKNGSAQRSTDYISWVVQP